MLSSTTRLQLCSICFLLIVANVKADSFIYVSFNGLSGNPGTRPAPVDLLSTAMPLVASGGVVYLLDSSRELTAVLNKSVTIEGVGGTPSLATYWQNTSAVLCSGDSNQVVTLRNLNVDSAPGAGAKGIYFAGRALVLENVTIRNCTIGIEVPSSNYGNVTLRNCAIENCGVGISTITASTAVTVTLDNVRINGCTTTGINAQNGTRVVMRGCDVSHNATGLICSRGAIASKAEIENCMFSFNVTAMQAGAGETIVRIANSTISNNTTGLTSTGGTFYTFGNNRVQGNMNDGVAMVPFALK